MASLVGVDRDRSHPHRHRIVRLYFGFRVRSFWMGVVFFGSLSLPLLLTIPRRYGLAIAITYLIRKRWPDSKDNFPPIGAK